MALVTNMHGEVVNVQEADQFQWANGKPLSQFMCGFFAVAIARSMAEVGHPPALSVAQVISDAEAWYAQFDGTDAITNTAGMSLAQLYGLLKEVGLHYQALPTDVSVVKGWLKAGYPVVVAVTETSVRDLSLGDTNPYPWTPAGTHIILVTGVTADGHLIVRDSANCTDLHNPNSLRPGPRKYDANKLQLVSATIVVPPWLPRPQSAVPPVVEEAAAVVVQEGIPQGWQDDGTTLTAPNGERVVRGFRGFVLAQQHWHPDNWPVGSEYGSKQLEGSNPTLGSGTQQVFRWTLLGYTPARGVFLEWVGQELVFTRAQVLKYYQLAVSLRNQLEQTVGK